MVFGFAIGIEVLFLQIILFYGLVSLCCANQYYGGGGGDGRMDSKQYFNLPKSNSPMVSKQLFELLPIHQDPPVEQVFNLFSGDLPVKLVFRSRSSPITIQQVHLASSPMKVQETSSEDVPHLVRHKVLRPVVQEVREIIQPMRTITQEIRPVLEEVHTVVAKKDVDGHHSGPKSQAKHVNKGRQYTPDNAYQPQPSPYKNKEQDASDSLYPLHYCHLMGSVYTYLKAKLKLY